MPPVALTIAGSDPIGGAGIQADLKTFHQFGVYGEAVITLLTVQNTVRMTRVDCIPAELVLAQLAAVLEDIPPQAAKTGALGNREIVEAIAAAAAGFRFPLVVDPVMIGKHGQPLVSADAIAAIRELLLPLAALICPNLHEAEELTGIRVLTVDDMRNSRQAPLRNGGQSRPGERRAFAGKRGGCLYSMARIGASLPPRISIRRTRMEPAALSRRALPRSWPAAPLWMRPWRAPRVTSPRPFAPTPAWGTAPVR
jgi:hypothetical protein